MLYQCNVVKIIGVLLHKNSVFLNFHPNVSEYAIWYLPEQPSKVAVKFMRNCCAMKWMHGFCKPFHRSRSNAGRSRFREVLRRIAIFQNAKKFSISLNHMTLLIRLISYQEIIWFLALLQECNLYWSNYFGSLNNKYKQYKYVFNLILHFSYFPKLKFLVEVEWKTRRMGSQNISTDQDQMMADPDSERFSGELQSY